MKEVTFTYTAQITQVHLVGDNQEVVPMTTEERERSIADLMKQHLGVDDVIVSDVKYFERELEESHES